MVMNHYKLAEGNNIREVTTEHKHPERILELRRDSQEIAEYNTSDNSDNNLPPESDSVRNSYPTRPDTSNIFVAWRITYKKTS